MAKEINVCLDLGNDTLKIAFAYDTPTGEVHGKLMLPDMVNQVALPAAACYDEDAREWRFAEELDRVDNSHFSTVVKIKSLLSLVTKHDNETVEERNREYYRKGHYFPKFCFPVRQRMRDDFQYLVDQKLVFEVPGSTPRSMCEEFFRHVRETVQTCIADLSEKTGIQFSKLRRLTLVHPPKQGEEYTEELSRLVREAFDINIVKVLTSTQALGLLSFHQGLVKSGERVLVFDMGDETVSVTKAWPNAVGSNVTGKKAGRVGILVDSVEAHSQPLDVGGSDIDEDIASYLEACIYERETVGSPAAGQTGHIYENGLCAQQYLLMKDIKKAKMVMPLTGKGIFRDGVPISIHRETLVQRVLGPIEFFACAGMDRNAGVANRILSYVLSEMSRPVNRDVSKVLFAGGTIESYGLLYFLTEHLRGYYPYTQVLTYETDRDDNDRFAIQGIESSTYAAALGGAIVAMRNYSVDAVLSYSYGTWLYHGNQNKHLTLFANRGDLLLHDKNRFAREAAMDIDRVEQEFLAGDELFSTTISMEEIKQHAYANRVTYDGDWLIVGEEGSEDRRRAREAIDLRVVAGGKGTYIRFFYKGEPVSLMSARPEVLYFEEGFVVDKKGVAKPFFTNLRQKNDIEIIVRLLNTNSMMSVNARDIEFRLYMGELKVTTNT